MSEFKNIFPGIGSSVLFAKNQMVVFGDPPNDDMIVEQKNVKSKTPVLYKSGIEQSLDESALNDLMSRVQLLTYSDAIASFQINADLLRQMKDQLSKWSCTHIRMFTHSDKLRVNMFDCRMNDHKLRVSRKNSLLLHHLDLEVRMFKDFTFTMKCSSFVKLPTDDYAIRVGDNGICLFMPAKSSVQYLLRDQELHEPMVTFQSPRVDAEIVFAPVPNL